jgi:AcrR family transcriptional regulator
MTRPKKRQREIEQTQAHILKAAARVFARKGYANSSMQEIAEEAEYSAPSLYSYFEGKQAILDKLISMIVEESKDLFNLTFPAGLTLRQKLEMLVRYQNDWVEHHRDSFLFLIRMGPPPSNEKEPPPDITEAYVVQLAAWFKEHDVDHELGGHSTEMVAYVLWGVRHAYFFRWLWKGASTPINDSIEEVLDLFFHGVFAKPVGGSNGSV